MLFELDPRTLLFVIALACVVSTAALASLWRINRNMPGPAWWLAASACMLLAFLISVFAPGLLGSGPPRALNNGLTLSAAVLNLNGVLHFRGFHRRWHHSALLWLIPVFFALSWLHRDATLLRHLFHDLSAALLLVGTAWALLWRLDDPQPRRTISLPAALCLIFAAALLWRWQLSLQQWFSGADTALSPATTLVFSALILFVFGWTLSMILASYYRINQRTQRQASLDALTGLPNRRSLDRELKHRLEQSAPFALVVMDLDGFKLVNDRLGHAAGDELLRIVAMRLRSSLRASDFIGRLGGDEFVALLNDDHQTLPALERLRKAVSAPVSIAGETLQIGVSLGLARRPQDGDSSDCLLHVADQRMYAEKAQRHKPHMTHVP